MRSDAGPDRRTIWMVRVGGWLLRLLASTWRVRVVHDEAVREARAARKPIIFALWHGQMLPLLMQHRNEGVAVLISEHGDGEIVARAAIGLGFTTVRGSTSRGAARALLELVRVAESGTDLAITPDGPRGPAESFAPGTAVVAQRSGAAVIAVAATASAAWRLRSWDRFMIPKPFARVRIGYSAAVYVNTRDSRDAVDEVPRLREAMSVAAARAAG